MSDPGPTDADRELLAEVATLGAQVSWSQLRRWRKAGAVPTPARPGAGRGRGRPNQGYPEGTAQVVVKVAEVLAEGFSLQEAVLALFLSGLPVREDSLRKELLDALDLAPEVRAEPDPDRRDDMVGELGPTMKRKAKNHPLVKHWSELSHGNVTIGPDYAPKHARPPEVFNDFLYAILSPALLGEVHPDGSQALAHMLDLTAAEVAAIEQALIGAIDKLQHAARHTPLPHLRQGVVALGKLYPPDPSAPSQRPNYRAAAIMAIALAVARPTSADSESALE